MKNIWESLIEAPVFAHYETKRWSGSSVLLGVPLENHTSVSRLLVHVFQIKRVVSVFDVSLISEGAVVCLCVSFR